jgi:tetratricopeptide (TPR) repeat protein
LRIGAAREAIELTQRAGHPEWVAPYLSGWHTGDLMELGDTAGAKATARFHLVTGETMREPFNEAVALAALSMIATHEGRFAEGEQLAVQALRCGTRFDRANASGIFGVQMFTIRREQGRLAEVAPIIKRLVDEHPDLPTWRPGFALIASDLGFKGPARRMLADLATTGFAFPLDAKRSTTLAYLAEVCVVLNDEIRAEALYALLEPYRHMTITAGVMTVCHGSAGRYLGMLADLLTRWDTAEEHFEEALELNHNMKAWPWLAHTQFDFARMLRRRGRPADIPRAETLLNESWATANRLDMIALKGRLRSQQH